MKTEFRKAELPGELRSLLAFDRKVFAKSDRFPAAYWRECESWWLLVDGRKVGCCAFEVIDTTLYIATTGILPRLQRRGFGEMFKVWQLAYAQHYGFARLETTSRKSNQAMIALNRKHGFCVVGKIRGYYDQPDETGVVMRLKLKRQPK